MIKKYLALLAAVMLLNGAAMAEGETTEVAEAPAAAAVTETAATAELPEGVSPLPIDFSGGKLPVASAFTDTGYSDPSISVTIETGRRDKCDYWIATIKIADASQLRTLSAGGFDSNAASKGESLAKRVNAVLAIDGDYASGTGEGYIVRQGEEYLNVLSGTRDVLVIDSNGDFHVFTRPQNGEVKLENTDATVVNAFYFGPILVQNGEVMPIKPDKVMVSDMKRQRMAICQVGPLEYKCICCGPPARGNAGMTLDQFAALVAEQGVQTAYNMDGGDSTMLILNGKKQNDVRSTSTRKLKDIIYFASAYDAEGAN